jgi:hypothetical protein
LNKFKGKVFESIANKFRNFAANVHSVSHVDELDYAKVSLDAISKLPNLAKIDESKA